MADADILNGNQVNGL